MAKNMRTVIEDGLRQLISAFNEDPYFKLAQISFSKNFEHFVDRMLERKKDRRRRRLNADEKICQKP